MTYLIISDIHGSYENLTKVIEQLHFFAADKIISLGDVYYHGPRNPLPEGYDPMKISELLNELYLYDSFKSVKGNCDAEVDQMISDFPFQKEIKFTFNKKKILCHHGHHEVKNIDEYDIIFQGHTHISKIEKCHETYIVNPGSISLPKAMDSQNFIIMNEKGITIYDLNTQKEINKIIF